MKRSIRDTGLTVRFSQAERRQIERAAQRAQLTAGAFVRLAALFFSEPGRDVRVNITMNTALPDVSAGKE